MTIVLDRLLDTTALEASRNLLAGPIAQRISVFGLGYVGAVTAACLSRLGHHVLGVDAIPAKVELLNNGQPPVLEKSLGHYIRDSVESGTLGATVDSFRAVHETDVSLICVGTPSKPNGELDLSHVAEVSRQIGLAIRSKATRHTIVLRSTVLPGTVRDVVIPAVERASQKRAGVDFSLGVNPEFLREGSAIEDFFNPSRTVVGAYDTDTANLIMSLIRQVGGEKIVTSIEIAEMVKYCDNVWHALKVSFANEIGTIAKAMGLDSHDVMTIFCKDKKLNISSRYLTPGFAFGGSCLPKDVRALLHRARSLDVAMPLIGSILPSNDTKISQAVDLVVRRGKRKVGLIGVSFKGGTDDLRESPLLELVERLIGKGFDVRIYDENINVLRLTGSNRAFALNSVPHISALLVDTLDEVIEHGEIIVLGQVVRELDKVLPNLNPEKEVLDLIRPATSLPQVTHYEGIAW